MSINILGHPINNAAFLYFFYFSKFRSTKFFFSLNNYPPSFSGMISHLSGRLSRCLFQNLLVRDEKYSSSTDLTSSVQFVFPRPNDFGDWGINDNRMGRCAVNMAGGASCLVHTPPACLVSSSHSLVEHCPGGRTTFVFEQKTVDFSSSADDDERSNDQTQASRLLPEQLRRNLFHRGLQDEARLLGSTFRPPSTLAYAYCSIPVYSINARGTFPCVVVFIELIKQNMPDMLLCNFQYNCGKISFKIVLKSSKLALRLRTM